jgi:hypothetical protein
MQVSLSRSQQFTPAARLVLIRTQKPPASASLGTHFAFLAFEVFVRSWLIASSVTLRLSRIRFALR